MKDIDLTLKTPIKDLGDEFKPVFQRLQGNIVKGHGRDYSVNIFFKFSSKGEQLRKDLKKIAEKYVTSAFEQHTQSDQFRRFGIPGGLFGNLFLTARAYHKLGYGGELEEWFKDDGETGGDFFPKNAKFISGMKEAAEDFNDRLSVDASTPLEKAYVDEEIDAMLLLADDGEQNVLREGRVALESIQNHWSGTVLAVEIGRALRNEEGEGIEHFGYADGRSQPLFLESDFAKDKNGALTERVNDKAKRRESGEIDIWNPLAPLDLVLLKDPGVEDPLAFGSYFVFRKLEQDVLRFAIAEQRLADKLGLEGADRERAGAMAVGRFRDGTPLVLSETDGAIPAKANNFRYDGLDANFKPKTEDDKFGLKCPFQAHVRKTNPRQSITNFAGQTDAETHKNEDFDLKRRIVRRGIPYGERTIHPSSKFQPLDQLPTGGVGLLFACFQKSIMVQFAFMQKAWVNGNDFKVKSTGIDPLIGQGTKSDEDESKKCPVSASSQHWRKEYGGTLEGQAPTKLGDLDLSKSHPEAFEFQNFIKFKGGEFFFTPSIPFLMGEAAVSKK